MKRKKKLLILAGVLAVLCVAIGVVRGVEKHIDSINTVDEEIISVDTDALTQVSWSYEGKTLTFVKTDDIWYSGDDDTFPVDQDAMQEFLDHFASVTASFIIEDVEDYGQYGLSDPQCTITLTEGDTDTRLELGDYSTLDSKRYVTRGDGTVYLIDDDLLEYISSDRDSLMDQDGVPEYDTIDSIEINGSTSLSIKYLPDENLCYSDSYEYYMDDNGTYQAVSASNVNDLMRTLKDLGYTDYVTYRASVEDLSEYGLDSPAFSYTITYTKDDKQNSFTLNFGQKESKYYVRMDDSEIVYQLEQETYETVQDTSYDTLRPSELVSVDWEQVTGVDITIGGETYEVTRKKDKWSIDDTEVEFQDVMDAVDALEVNEFKDKTNSKKEEISMELHLDNETFPTVSFTICQYDGENCGAELDGTAIGLISRDLVATLTEAVNAITLGLE